MRTAMIVLGISLVLGCGDITVPTGEAQGAAGENCTKKADCLAGLGCFDGKCGVAGNNPEPPNDPCGNGICEEGWLGNGECNPECDCDATNRDEGDCGQENQPCGNGFCDPEWIGDGNCQPECNCPEADNDGGDCGQENQPCGNGFCDPEWIGDGNCNPECNCPEADNDGGDCGQENQPCGNGFCDPAWIGDGNCQPECNCPEADNDGGDCVQEIQPCGNGFCDPAWIGDGNCNPECNCPEADNDGGDCLGQPSSGCTNPQDNALFTENTGAMVWWLAECSNQTWEFAGDAFFNGDHETFFQEMSGCLQQDQMGFTEGCASCFAGYAVCGAAECSLYEHGWDYTETSSASNCLVNSCDFDFSECAGLNFPHSQ